MKGFLLCIVFLVSLVYGHNWITSPVTRDGNTASQSTPCDPGTPQVVTRYRGDPINIQWTTNHPEGENQIFLVTSDQESNLESLTTPFASYDYTIGSTSENIPGDLKPGRYIAQYRWETWRNCVDLLILAKPPSGATSAATESNPYLYAIQDGSFDASTGVTSCNDGFVPASDGTCTSSGGRVFGILLLVALILAVVIIGGYSIYLKINDPQKFDKKYASVKKTLHCSGSEPSV